MAKPKKLDVYEAHKADYIAPKKPTLVDIKPPQLRAPRGKSSCKGMSMPVRCKPQDLDNFTRLKKAEGGGSGASLRRPALSTTITLAFHADCVTHVLGQP